MCCSRLVLKCVAALRTLSLLSVPCLSTCSSVTVTCAVLRVPSFLLVVVSGRVDPLFGQVWGTLSALALALLIEELDGAATLRYYPRTAAEDMADTIGQEIGQGVVASTFRLTFRAGPSVTAQRTSVECIFWKTIFRG